MALCFEERRVPTRPSGVCVYKLWLPGLSKTGVVCRLSHPENAAKCTLCTLPASRVDVGKYQGFLGDFASPRGVIFGGGDEPDV